jgi:DNA-binding CsgD family transcriptional regulator
VGASPPRSRACIWDGGISTPPIASEALAGFRAINDRQGAALSLVTLGAASLRRGEVDAARERLDESIGVFSELGSRRELCELLELLGAVAFERAEYARSVRLFGAADALLAALGSALRSADRPRYAHSVAEARTQLGAAIFDAEWQAGSGLDLEHALADALGSADQPRADRPGAPSGGRGRRDGVLTRREQEVVAVLAHGLGNHEIARTLVISERTAETHVGKILDKLGLVSRAQVTAWAMRHSLISPIVDSYS